MSFTDNYFRHLPVDQVASELLKDEKDFAGETGKRPLEASFQSAIGNVCREINLRNAWRSAGEQECTREDAYQILIDRAQKLVDRTKAPHLPKEKQLLPDKAIALVLNAHQNPYQPKGKPENEQSFMPRGYVKLLTHG